MKPFIQPMSNMLLHVISFLRLRSVDKTRGALFVVVVGTLPWVAATEGEFEYLTNESFLSVAVDVPLGSSGLAVGETRPMVVSVSRTSYEVWTDGVGGVDYREQTVEPVSGASLTLQVAPGSGHFPGGAASDSGATDASAQFSSSFTLGIPAAVEVTIGASDGTLSTSTTLTFEPADPEEWTDDHEESLVRAQLNWQGGMDDIPLNTVIPASVTVFLDTWMVQTSSLGNSRVANLSSSPLEGAVVSWSVAEGGDLGIGQNSDPTDSQGNHAVQLTMGSLSSTVNVSVSSAGEGAAEVTFVLNPAAPPPEAGFSHTSVVYLESIDGPLDRYEIEDGTVVAVSGTLLRREDEVWLDENGDPYTLEGSAVPVPYSPLSVNVFQGDAALSTTAVSTGLDGRFTFEVVMGSIPSTVCIHSALADGTTVPSLRLYPSAETWSTSNTYSQLEIDLQSPAYSAVPEQQVVLTVAASSVIYHHQISNFGNTREKLVSSVPAVSQTISFDVASGGSLLPGSSVTDANGILSRTFVMGATDASVSAWIVGTNAADSVSLALVPESYTFDRNEASISVTVTADGPVENLPLNTSRTITALVTRNTWERWVSNYGNVESRATTTSAAENAAVQFSVITGNGVLTSLTEQTDPTGRAVTTFTVGSALSHIIRADSSFMGSASFGTLTVTRMPEWEKISEYKELDVTLGQPDAQVPALKAVAELRHYEVWQRGTEQETRLVGTLHPSGAGLTFTPVTGTLVFQSPNGNTGLDGSFQTPFASTGTPQASVHCTFTSGTQNLTADASFAVPLTAANLDGDNDGLSSAQELAQGTSAWDDDSDNDGVLDGDEVAFGTDPLSASSTPPYVLTAVSGQGQAAEFGQVTSSPLTVRVTRAGRNAAGRSVEFTAAGGGLSQAAAGPWNATQTVITDAQGLAAVYWKAPPTVAGQVPVTATIPGAGPVNFSPNSVDPITQDHDGDGLTGEEELALGTLDDKQDSDGDTVNDALDAVPYDPSFTMPRVTENFIPIPIDDPTRTSYGLDYRVVTADGAIAWRTGGAGTNNAVWKRWKGGVTKTITITGNGTVNIIERLDAINAAGDILVRAKSTSSTVATATRHHLLIRWDGTVTKLPDNVTGSSTALIAMTEPGLWFGPSGIILFGGVDSNLTIPKYFVLTATPTVVTPPAYPLYPSWAVKASETGTASQTRTLYITHAGPQGYVTNRLYAAKSLPFTVNDVESGYRLYGEGRPDYTTGYWMDDVQPLKLGGKLNWWAELNPEDPVVANRTFPRLRTPVVRVNPDTDGRLLLRPPAVGQTPEQMKMTNLGSFSTKGMAHVTIPANNAATPPRPTDNTNGLWMNGRTRTLDAWLQLQRDRGATLPTFTGLNIISVSENGTIFTRYDQDVNAAWKLVALVPVDLLVNTDRSFDPVTFAETLNGADEQGEDTWSYDRGAALHVNYDTDADLTSQSGPLFDAITYNAAQEPSSENWTIENATDAMDLAKLELPALDGLSSTARVYLRTRPKPAPPAGIPDTQSTHTAEVAAFHAYLVNNSVAGTTSYVPFWGGRMSSLKPSTVAVTDEVEITKWVNSKATGYQETRPGATGSYRLAVEGILFAGMPLGNGEAFDGDIRISLCIDPGSGVRANELDVISLGMPKQEYDSEGRAKATKRKDGSYADSAVARDGDYLLPAFPTAEGFGRWSSGGRYGAVLVTTKNTDDGSAGTLRWALTQNVPRTVIIRLPSGTDGNIALTSRLDVNERHRFTVAGQSGNPGVCLQGYGMQIAGTEHGVIRYIRIRPKTHDNQDCLRVTRIQPDGPQSDYMIVDHCSTTWGTDETLSVDVVKRVTLQWNLIADSMGGGGDHAFGSLLRGTNDGSSLYSAHHNFWARHKGRMPRVGGDAYSRNDDKSQAGALIDVRNNVMWRYGSYCANSEDYYKWAGESGHDVYFDSPCRYNFVSNYFYTEDDTYLMKEASPFGQGHYSGNSRGTWMPPDQSPFVEFLCAANIKVNANDADDLKGCWLPGGAAPDGDIPGFDQNLPTRPQRKVATGGVSKRDKSDYMRQTEFSVSDPVATEPAGPSLFSNLAAAGGVGASHFRDALDNEILDDKSTLQMDYPVLSAQAPQTDTDGDGVPDNWENSHGMNRSDPKDASLDPDGNGYSHLEEWLTSLVTP